MFENYVSKIYVSSHPNFSTPLEATAFGFDDGESQKLLTAAHVVTDVLGKTYPASNTVTLYVKFHSHHGPVNAAPVPVDFILNNCNDSNNFKENIPFVDSAEMVLPAEMQQPVSSYFKGRAPAVGMDTLGVGYPLRQIAISTFPGKITSIWPLGCTNHSAQHLTSRFVIPHHNSPGCSGGPYIISEGDEYFVIGSLIGLMSGTSQHSNPHMSVQSATDF
ncbi:TPA: hypothetical protein PXL76_002158 [Yersinia enterocolitica]|nr:hypothetical protein [Yersinia enterocolitica]HDL6890686.1 hypothetical protein [Yersinia enterocolitica]